MDCLDFPLELFGDVSSDPGEFLELFRISNFVGDAPVSYRLLKPPDIPWVVDFMLDVSHSINVNNRINSETKRHQKMLSKNEQEGTLDNIKINHCFFLLYIIYTLHAKRYSPVNWVFDNLIQSSLYRYQRC